MARNRKIKAKDGELRVAWGYDEDGEGPDLCFAWGEGTKKADSWLLHGALSLGHYDRIRDKYDPNLLTELKNRGYDLSTLVISIRKKQP